MDTIKICKECGKSFVAKTPRQLYCKESHYRPCPVCSSPVLVKSLSDPPRCCSTECVLKQMQATSLKRYGTIDAGNSDSAKAKRKQTNLAKYGVENPAMRKDIMDKQRATIQAKYGVNNVGATEEHKHRLKEIWRSKSTEEMLEIQQKREATCELKYGTSNPRQCEAVKEKTKKTLLDKYGVDCSLLIPEVKEKVQTTMIQRYGVLNPGQNAEIRKKAEATSILRYGVPKYSMTEEGQAKFRMTMQQRYGVDNPMQNSLFTDKAKRTNLERYGVPAAFLTDESLDKARASMLANSHSRISKPNQLFSELLNDASIPNEFEFRVDNRWYDIHILDTNILLEIDPTYTHSNEPTIYGDGLDKNYHKMKSELAVKHKYRCIHIFDWDDLNKIVALVSPISRRLYARNIECKLIKSEDADMFLEIHHVQGKVRNQEVCLGLLSDDELLSVMTFGRPRYNKNVQWELYRYACQSGLAIVGGASKLFSHFIDLIHPKSIVSYCDLSKFNGHVYSELGFQLAHTSSPTKIWSKGKRYITNNLLLQRGYDQLFGTCYGKDTSNEELMIENGWRSVYDCGQRTYIYMNPADFQ